MRGRLVVKGRVPVPGKSVDTRPLLQPEANRSGLRKRNDPPPACGYLPILPPFPCIARFSIEYTLQNSLHALSLPAPCSGSLSICDSNSRTRHRFVGLES